MAPLVFEHAQRGDAYAKNILTRSADALAENVLACARQLAYAREEPFTLALAGKVRR